MLPQLLRSSLSPLNSSENGPSPTAFNAKPYIKYFITGFFFLPILWTYLFYNYTRYQTRTTALDPYYLIIGTLTVLASNLIFLPTSLPLPPLIPMFDPLVWARSVLEQ